MARPDAPPIINPPTIPEPPVFNDPETKVTTEVGTTDPTLPEIDSFDENGEYAMRVACLQYASMVSTPETPLTEFLDKAAQIEAFVRTGKVIKDKES